MYTGLSEECVNTLIDFVYEAYMFCLDGEGYGYMEEEHKLAIHNVNAKMLLFLVDFAMPSLRRIIIRCGPNLLRTPAMLARLHYDARTGDTFIVTGDERQNVLLLCVKNNNSPPCCHPLYLDYSDHSMDASLLSKVQVDLQRLNHSCRNIWLFGSAGGGDGGGDGGVSS